MSEDIYDQFKDTLVWNILNKSIQALVDNQVFEEKAPRKYLIGYLISQLENNKCLNSHCLIKNFQ